MNEPKPADEEAPVVAEIRGGDRPSDYIPDGSLTWGEFWDKLDDDQDEDGGE